MESAVIERHVVLTERAAARIRKLRDQEGNAALMLRLSVSGGGCAGFSYGFALETERAQDDLLFQQHGVSLVIDQTSLDLLDGAVVDYVEDLMGSAFSVRNPNAVSTCGCGTSFSV